MKFRITMKDPDTLHDAIEFAARKSLAGIEDADERAALKQVRMDKMSKVAGCWFKYGEYLTVEIDTDAGTCTVIESKDQD